mgnify:FL=1
MTYQLVFTIDFNRCINCKTCEMACNSYYGLTGAHRRNVLTFDNEPGKPPVHLSMSCNHCKNPICVSVCPENNFQKRRDGIVVHEANHCRACTRCITACPFQAPKLNPLTNRADKCNFCVERIDEGLKPVCVENCVTAALSVMTLHAGEPRPDSLKHADIPLMSYTEPSIFLTIKRPGKIYLRKG